MYCINNDLKITVDMAAGGSYINHRSDAAAGCHQIDVVTFGKGRQSRKVIGS